MSDKINRARRLDSAKTTEKSSRVKVEGFEKLVSDLQAIAMANQKSQDAITNSINQLSQIIVKTGDEGPNMSALVDAINSLKEKIDLKNAVKPEAYVIDFERDKRTGLMKSGIELTPKRKRLN